MPGARYADAALFVLLATLWGTAFVAVEVALSAVPPVLLAAFRYDLAGVLVLAYAAATTERWRPSTRADVRLVLAGGALLIAANYALLFSGQQYVTGGVAAVLTGLSPVLTPVFAAALLPEGRVDRAGAAGTLLGFVGVAVVARLDPSNLLDGNVLGVALVSLAAASFSLGGVLTQRMRTDLPAVSVQAWMMLVGAVLLHGVSAASPTESLGAVRWSPEAALALGYLAVGAGAGGFLVYFELLNRLGAVEVNLVSYVVPVVAAMSGWALLGEPLHAETAVGFCCIVAGFALLKRRALAGELRRLRAAGGD